MELIERLENRIERLEKYKSKIESMFSCTIVEHGFYDMSVDYAPMFYGDKDKISYSLDAAGDLSGGFSLVKQGLMKEVDFNIEELKDRLAELLDMEGLGK